MGSSEVVVVELPIAFFVAKETRDHQVFSSLNYRAVAAALSVLVSFLVAVAERFVRRLALVRLGFGCALARLLVQHLLVPVRLAQVAGVYSVRCFAVVHHSDSALAAAHHFDFVGCLVVEIGHHQTDFVVDLVTGFVGHRFALDSADFAAVPVAFAFVLARLCLPLRRRDQAVLPVLCRRR